MAGSRYLTLLALFILQGWLLVAAVELSLCSSLNTGSNFSAEKSDFQSFGACKDTCGDNYAFAIMQGKSCWCSNAAPGDTVSNDECTTKCGGYPDEKCGSIREKLFAYYELNKEPSTTIGSPKTTSSTAAATTSLDPASVTVTVTELPTKALDTSTTFSTVTTTSETSSTSSSPVTTESPSVSTIDGNIVTITVPNNEPASTSSSGSSANTKSESLDGGQVAGVIIGSLIGFAIIAALILWYFCFYRRRQKKKPVEQYRDPFYQSPVPRPIFEPTSNGRSVRAVRTVSHDANGMPSTRLSVPAFTDNRMKREIYSHGSRHSNISLQDHHDYTRPVLRLTNPDTPASTA